MIEHAGRNGKTKQQTLILGSAQAARLGLAVYRPKGGGRRAAEH
jgi:hypothetical protein